MTGRRILAVDDEVKMQRILEIMLQDMGHEVLRAGNGREALAVVEREPVDLIVTDLRMPEMDGVEAIGKIKEKYPNINILVLTTYDTDADIVRAVEAGATGYLLKDAPREELFRAVRATAKGETVLAPVVAARLMGKVRDHGEQALSAREIDVLMLVARGASNQDVAEKLYVSTATVKSHLIQIYQKLGVSDRTAAVTTAIERGIIRLS